MRLAPGSIEAGIRLIAHDEIASTNTEALRLARSGETGPLWITARRQSAGRGRRGRTWTSERGNLYASLLLSDAAPRGRVAELSLVAAVAVHDAVLAAAPGLRGRLSVKWPNDLLLDRAKIAGILLEGEQAGDRLASVIGIGINCTSHPAEVGYPATDLAAAGTPAAADDVFERLSASMRARLAEWERGFASIRSAWLAIACGLGEPIRVRLPERELTGRFETLDESGRLVLRLPGGRIELVSAGEVFPVRRGEECPAQ